MDYPHGHVNHHRHHHNNRRHDDEHDNPNTIYPPPPPPFTQSPYPPHQTYPPPPPPHGHVYPPHPPPPSYGGDYNPYPPPPLPRVESRNYPPSPPDPDDHHHRFHPHVPGFIGSHFHHDGHGHGVHESSSNHSYGPGMGLGELVNKPSLKIYCKAGGERYAVGVRDGKLVLMHPDYTDSTQHWYKDERYSTKVKDKDSHPSFILVNKGTQQAVKHSVSCHPVQLAPYRPDVLDESVLWTESRDMGSNFRTIRTVNNVRLVMDAWNADKDHGGLHDGTVVALYETWKGDNKNQQWKLVRH